MQWRGALLERDDEVSLLELAQAEARSDGRVVLIEGQAGIGKTRLLEVLRQQAGSSRVLAAHGGALERDMAFGVVRQLLEGPVLAAAPTDRASLLAAAAAPAAEVLGLAQITTMPGPTDVGRSLHGLYWLVANLARHQPVVLSVDDVHWADPASLHFLAYLARRIDGLPVLIAMATRDGEPWSSEEAKSVLVGQASILRPAPLSTAAVGKLVGLAFDAPGSEELVEACRMSAGGNPFYLGELLAAIAQPGRRPADVSIDSVRATVPSTVARSILMRLGRLGDPSVRLAMAAALLGEGASLLHAAKLAELPVADAEELADGLVDASILAGIRPIQFVHPIVHAAIAGEVPPARRGSLHRQAALVLKDDGAAVEQIVPHLLRASPTGDAWVVETLQVAAAALSANGAPDSAARCLRRALEEPAPAGHAPWLLAQLSAAELAGGSYAESAADAGRALALVTDPAARARIRHLQSYALLSVAGAAAALRCLEQAVGEAAGADPDLALQLEGDLVVQSWMAGVPYPVADRLDSYREVAGDTYGEQWVLAVLAFESLRRAEPADAARSMALRALAGGDLLANQSATTMAYYTATVALLAAEAFDDARQAVADGFADVRARGLVYGYGGICWLRGLLELAEGDLVAAEADERACVEHAVPTMVGIGVASLALVLLEQGDVAGASAELERGGLLSDDRPLYVWGPYVRGLVRLAQGRTADAVADLEDVGRHGREIGGMSAGLPWRGHAALAYEAAGDRLAAERLAAEEMDRARRHGGARTLGGALRVAGLLASGAERLSLLAEAVSALERSPARLDLARARHDHGVALLRAGRRREGRAVLERSYDEARTCGARGLAESTYNELLVAGARPRRPTFTGAASLTASERRVAQMAARGMTNRDIAQALYVTAKTVENQLGRVYTKLAVSSRRALHDALADEPDEAGHPEI